MIDRSTDLRSWGHTASQTRHSCRNGQAIFATRLANFDTDDLIGAFAIAASSLFFSRAAESGRLNGHGELANFGTSKTPRSSKTALDPILRAETLNLSRTEAYENWKFARAWFAIRNKS